MELVADIRAYIEANLDYLPGFLLACEIVVEVTLLTIVLSWVFGLIAALAKSAPYRLIRLPAEFYIWFVRGTPTLIQIFMIYFGLPQLGLRLPPFLAGVVALALNEGAYIAEILRSGLGAIPRGQRESAVALGMSSFQSLRRIIIPQVIRITLPALTNEAITTLKNTSLLSTITVVELTLHTQMIIAQTFRPFEFYGLTAALYLAMTTLLTRIARWLEKRYTLYI